MAIDTEKEREALRAAIQSFEWKEKDIRQIRQDPDKLKRADILAGHIETMRAMLTRYTSAPTLPAHLVAVECSDLQDAIRALNKECYVGETLRNLEAALSATEGGV